MLMGAGSLKSRGQQDRAPPAASRKESFLAPSSFRWWLGILGVHWLVGAPLQALPPRGLLLPCVSVSGPLLQGHRSGSRAHPNRA